jgi:hypothetical protein
MMAHAVLRNGQWWIERQVTVDGVQHTETWGPWANTKAAASVAALAPVYIATVVLDANGQQVDHLSPLVPQPVLDRTLYKLDTKTVS